MFICQSQYGHFIIRFRLSESFHIVIYMTQVTCSYVSIIHYFGLSIYVHMLVSRLKSDCDCYFYCTFNTLTT